jgi:ABC-type spermidine/putrescine transport system permease subunit I
MTITVTDRGSAGTLLRGAFSLTAGKLVVPSLVLLAIFLFWPLLNLLELSFLSPAGEISTAHYDRILTRPVYRAVLQRTFEIALYVTLVCVIVGYPVAYAISRLSEVNRRRVLLFVVLPFWTGFLVRSFAWILLLQNSGVINSTLRSLGLIEQPLPLIYNLFGVLVATVHMLLPYAILSMLGVMERIDPRLVSASRSMGASPFLAFAKVYFPLSLPGVASAGLLVFVMCLGFFVTPALLGSPRETVISQLIATQINTILNWGFGAALAFVLLATTLLCYFVYARYFGLDSIVSVGTPAANATAARRGLFSSFKPGTQWLTRRLRRGWDGVLALIDGGIELVRGKQDRPLLSHAIQWIFSGLVLAFLLVPILIVIPISLTGADYIEFPPSSLSLRWYQTFFSDPQWVGATLRSLRVGIAAALLATLLGGMAAIALGRGRIPAAATVSGLLLAPMILPRMVIAIAVFRIYAQFGLVGTELGLVVAHTVLAIPVAMITIAAVLQNFDVRLEHAAMTLGATRLGAFRRVTLPTLKTGFLSAALFAFVVSFDELIIAIFIAGGTGQTLPRKMWDEIYLQVTPTLAAVSTLILLAVVVGALLGHLIQARVGRRAPSQT